jgi:hypothetical protein
VAEDDGGGPFQSRLARNRPDDLVDGCLRRDGVTWVREALVYGEPGTCAIDYPIYSNTRLVAGEPLTRDVLKCQLVPIDFASYSVSFTPEQQARLQAAFPGGVCDYSRPGVGQQPPIGAWLTY